MFLSRRMVSSLLSLIVTFGSIQTSPNGFRTMRLVAMLVEGGETFNQWRQERAKRKAEKYQPIVRQLLRSGTSVGAQYREATRAKSNADFISKIEGSLQELEETEYWLELLAEAGLCRDDGLRSVKRETGELKGIFVSIVRNTKAKAKPPKS